MNDFTKEELESILEGITWWLDGDSAIYCDVLINKIQSMIDNYCELKLDAVPLSAEDRTMLLKVPYEED